MDEENSLQKDGGFLWCTARVQSIRREVAAARLSGWSRGSAVRKQRDGGCHSAFFSIFIWSMTPALGMVLSRFRVGLPTSVSPVWKILHRYAQGFVSK